ncbi:DUF2487 family protein [Lentibacillus sp. N15]|uniref:DUF2487 family protein n=1 Tax=Lentibacillus songyuanensis TaxID=3136161 RepID=UPI0031BA3098
MQWSKHDLQQYIKAKEYVDTLIIPLLPFQLAHDETLEKSAFQGEVLSIFANAIEKELTGRVLLSPSYIYLNTKEMDAEIKRLHSWVENGRAQPFEHVFFVTFDAKWKRHEQELNGTLLWLPGIQTGDIQSKEMLSFIRDQVSQISELIQSYWS